MPARSSSKALRVPTLESRLACAGKWQNAPLAATKPLALTRLGFAFVRGTVTVDCSADGDVAARAGVPFEIGRAEDGWTQPMTLFFRVREVDDERVAAYCAAHPEDYRPFASLVQQARERGEFSIPRRGVGLYKTLQPGVWRINTTRVQRLTATSADDLTRAEIEGRRQAQELLAFFRKWLPGFERSRAARHGDPDRRPRDRGGSPESTRSRSRTWPRGGSSTT